MKTAKEQSDYDIGIECDSTLPLDVWADIRLDLDDLPVMQKIDVVDFGRTTEDFRRVAKERVEILYEQ
ncbi:MAG: nucleotidyltransferase domain-containing protein [Elusimicrobia bacterium]|nr:nucleotidyltransferase domain-containing protein [Elusimicrobiota bacterium]